MFGMQFFVNFETKFLIIFVKGIDNKISHFKWIQNGPTKMLFFIRHTLEENKHNFCLKIDKKLHTKHHQIDQKLWKLIDLMMFDMQLFEILVFRKKGSTSSNFFSTFSCVKKVKTLSPTFSKYCVKKVKQIMKTGPLPWLFLQRIQNIM